MTLQTEAASLKALIAAATSAPALDLTEGKALASLPGNYVEVHLSYVIADQPRRLDGSREYGLRRLTTRVLGKTVNNAYDMQGRILAAFAHQTVTVGGVATVVDLEVPGDPPAWDDGYYSTTSDWTYAV